MASTDLGAERRERLLAARLYLVCPAEPPGRGLADLVREAVAGGVDLVQLRDKTLTDDELAAVANAARALCARLGVLLIVNDRPSVAAESGADGVHVGQDDSPVDRVRDTVGPDLLIGLSTHSPEEVQGAGDVDYIGVGPVYETPTKPGRAQVGLELVEHAAARAPVPFFAIGGIDAGNVADVVAAGARRVAVVRAIAEADDPQAAARALRDAVEREPLA
jgi:thiamine-phosphate pyrophosphorylase